MIEKAIIPAGGYGSRLFPITQVVPKELLPILNKPMIQFSVDEAILSGINKIGIVYRDEKTLLKRYFKENLFRQNVDFSFLLQSNAQGLGHAILVSEHWTAGSEFGVLLPDDIIIDKTPCIRTLTNLYKKYGASIVAVENVDDVRKYGIIKGKRIDEDVIKIEDLVEKPTVKKAPSKLGIVGRYVLTPEIFNCLKRIKKNTPKNIELTNAIRLLLKKEDVYAYLISGKRYDCGNLDGYIKTFIDFSKFN